MVKRGEVYLYVPVLKLPGREGYTRTNLRVITSSDELNDRPGQRRVRGMHIIVERPETDLLAFETEWGWVPLITDETILISRLDMERGVVGRLTTDQLEALDRMIRVQWGV